MHPIRGGYVVGLEAKTIGRPGLFRMWLRQWRECDRGVYVVRHKWVDDRVEATRFTIAEARWSTRYGRNCWIERA